MNYKGVVFVSPDIFKPLHEKSTKDFSNLVFIGEVKVFEDPKLPEMTMVGDTDLIEKIEEASK